MSRAKKARIEPEAKESVSLRASEDGSDSDPLDGTVMAAPKITLKGSRPPSAADSILDPAPISSSASNTPGSAATHQVISDTKVDEDTGNAKDSVFSAEKIDEKAAKREKVHPALDISDLGTRFS